MYRYRYLFRHNPAVRLYLELELLYLLVLDLNLPDGLLDTLGQLEIGLLKQEKKNINRILFPVCTRTTKI